MKTRILLWLCGVALFLGACREEFDDHYNKVNDASIGKNVTQVLEEKGGFDLFLQMIRRADLERTLSQSGLYTCFAPKDEHVQPWLDENGWTVATMPERKLIEFINYHFMLGMTYYYNFEKVYENTEGWDKQPERYNYYILKDTRTSGKAYPAKKLRVFTKSYLDLRADDYRKMEKVEPGDFMVENVPVSTIDRDIPTSNGVIHVLDGPLLLMPRMDEAMAADPELSIITKWFDRFSGYATVGEENDKIDTTLMKYYDVAVKPTGNKVMNIANEAFVSTALLPTDAAMQEYFGPYLTPDLLTSFDSVPNELVVPFLQSLVFDYTYVWGISDIDRNYPYFYSYGNVMAMISNRNDIPAMFTESVVSSNSMIYKLNKVPETPLMTTVGGGFYIRHKHYKEWLKLIDKVGNLLNLNGLFGVNNSYQHQSRVVLIQPDDSKAWDNGDDKEWGVDGYNSDYMDTLAMRLISGVLIAELENNNFERRFYLTGGSNYVLADKESGKTVFTDYTGKKINLLNEQPVWTAENGAIFEVDGIFTHLLSSDSTQLLYREYIAKEENLSRFKELVEKAELTDLLDRVNNNYFTVFAPSNTALKGLNISDLEVREAQSMVRKCIVSGRRMFTDGFSGGVFTMLDGSSRTLSGAWEGATFSSQYGTARFILDESNRQGSNGVLHVVDKLILN